MSQGDIMKVLGKLGKNEWISTADLIKLLKLNRGTVASNIMRLRRYNEIESRRVKIENWGGSTQSEHRLTWKGKE